MIDIAILDADARHHRTYRERPQGWSPPPMLMSVRSCTTSKSDAQSIYPAPVSAPGRVRRAILRKMLRIRRNLASSLSPKAFWTRPTMMSVTVSRLRDRIVSAYSSKYDSSTNTHGTYPLTVGNSPRYKWVQGRSTPSGHPFWYVERVMPQIKPGLLNSVVYLYRSNETAEQGEQYGGSGFLVSLPFGSDPNLRHFYVVTCRHVIQKGSPVVRLTTHSGETAILDLRESDWFLHHFEDVAVCPVRLSSEYSQFAIPRENFVDSTFIEDNTPGGPFIGPGNDVFFLGRFMGHDGRQRNLPTVRFGNVAISGTTLLERKDNTTQDSFLVEAHSFPGYSGAAALVVALPHGASLGPAPSIMAAKLLGIVWCFLRDYVEVLSENKETAIPEMYVKQNSGMTGVVPAWKLSELLDAEELVQMRKKREKDHKRDSEHVEESTAVPPFTKADFMDALKKASGPEKPDPEKSDRSSS